MESAREARRRKILERGSDRIRMITAGSVNAPAAQPDQENQRGKGEGDEILDSVSSTAAPTEEIEITNTPLIDSSKDLETKRETLIDPFPKQEETFKSNDEITLEKPEEPKIESQIKRGETQMPPNYKTNNNNQKWIFTPNQISRAISNSEIIRLIFVIFFSFLVIKGFITSKPLLILILTDITIIIGLLIANKDDNNNNNKKNKNKREKENYNMPVDKISIIIEIGILLQKGLSAIFIDSCIYAVIMICALGI